MKTNFKKLFLLATFCFIPNLVHAESACSYSEQVEINNIVANVRANYEPVKIYAGKTLDIDNQDENGNIPEIDYYERGFNISILNITEDIYVKVSNDKDGNVITFRYNDTQDGVAMIQTSETTKMVTYTIEVYSNKYSCIGEMFRKFTITTPIFNDYSSLATCQENPEFYYCQEYLSSENITLNDFLEKMNDYKTQKEEKKKEEEEKNKSFLQKIKEFYKKYTIFINLGGSLVVIAGVATTVILIKKKRSRVL